MVTSMPLVAHQGNVLFLLGDESAALAVNVRSGTVSKLPSVQSALRFGPWAAWQGQTPEPVLRLLLDAQMRDLRPLQEYNKCHDSKTGRFSKGPCGVGGMSDRERGENGLLPAGQGKANWGVKLEGSHGSVEAALALAEEDLRLLAEKGNDARERAYMIDAKGTIRGGADGDAKAVDTSTLQSAAGPMGNGWVFTHSHPGGGGFSDKDMAWAAYQAGSRGLREMRAVDARGTWVMRFNRAMGPTGGGVFAAEYRRLGNVAFGQHKGDLRDWVRDRSHLFTMDELQNGVWSGKKSLRDREPELAADMAREERRVYDKAADFALKLYNEQGGPEKYGVSVEFIPHG